MDNRRVGVFDSGVGGLSILREIQALLPQESFVFVADQKHFPYGQKTQPQLEDLTTKIVRFLISEGVKLIVVACNTATINTIEHLRENFPLPIVGVVPVVKKLAEVTSTKKVGILATPLTSRSPYLQELISTHTGGIQVFNRDGGGLEELIEKGDLDSSEVTKTLQAVLIPMKKAGIDALALGCTHYPFLKEQIKKVVGPDVLVLDSGGAVARQVKRILENNNALSGSRGSDLYFTSGDKEKFQAVAEKLLGKKLNSVNLVHLDK